MNVKKLAVTVPLATTDPILDIDVSDLEEIALTIENAGANAFDAFQVLMKAHKDADEIIVASIAGDFSTPVFPLRRCIGTPVSLAVGNHATIFLSVAGMARLILKASAAVGASQANIWGQGFVA